MVKVSLSVVVPSYNEMANLQKGPLEKIYSYLKHQSFSFEVIIVDDGSNDGSREFVEKFIIEHKEFKLLKNNHMGKAGAVTSGMLAASGEYILFTDMDQATPIEELEKLLPFIKDGYDIVIGSRNNQRKGAPFSRKVMAMGMITLRSVLVGLSDISDTQCGFKLFKKDAAKKIFSKIDKIHSGFKKIKSSSVTAGFDIELLYIGQKMKYKIKEVPVGWLYVETRRVSPVRDSLDGFLELIRIRSRIINGTYR